MRALFKNWRIWFFLNWEWKTFPCSKHSGNWSNPRFWFSKYKWGNPFQLFITEYMRGKKPMRSNKYKMKMLSVMSFCVCNVLGFLLLCICQQNCLTVQIRCSPGSKASPPLSEKKMHSFKHTLSWLKRNVERSVCIFLPALIVFTPNRLLSHTLFAHQHTVVVFTVSNRVEGGWKRKGQMQSENVITACLENSFKM